MSDLTRQFSGFDLERAESRLNNTVEAEEKSQLRQEEVKLRL